jgi:hypothetical protein
MIRQSYDVVDRRLYYSSSYGGGGRAEGRLFCLLLIL